MHKPFKTDDGSWSLIHGVHGEAFHGALGAKSEAQLLYIESSSFGERIRSSPIRVLDVGLGLGYNALTTIENWLQIPERHDLVLDSLECDLNLVRQLLTGCAPWQKGWPPLWLAWLRGISEVSSQQFQLNLGKPGRALKWSIYDSDTFFCQTTKEAYDYIWQDPFSPKVSPRCWSQGWFEDLAARSQPLTELLTYSVAGHVRRNLDTAGFTPQKIPTTSTKKHWLKAVYR
jgi:tRNA U34 5-methylaminomethyl-2-thiouridine-forming methyltransferase MnmC